MARLERPSFLFVDQDPRWLEALRRTSKDLPGPKHFARSAEEALELMQEHQPTVVVSCYGLPGLDGLSLLEEVLARYPWVACVLFTAHPAKQLRSARGIALVEKGSAPGRLKAALDALCRALSGRHLRLVEGGPPEEASPP